MGRMGSPEEVAEAVLWLCSEATSFVTGHAMAIDGGYVSGLRERRTWTRVARRSYDAALGNGTAEGA